MYYLITWKKDNGDILVRLNSSYAIFKRIGDKNNYGWEIIDIHKYCDGNWLHEEDYRKMREKKKKKRTPLRKIILKKIIRTLNKLDK